MNILLEHIENERSIHNHLIEIVMKQTRILSKKCALKLYVDLCNVQIAVSNNTLSDSIKFSDFDKMLRFHKLIIENGKMIEILSDIIDDKTNTWTKKEKEFEIQRKLHKQNSEYFALYSDFLFKLRKRSENSYSMQRKRFKGNETCEWKQLIYLDVDSLEKKDHLFWYAVQTNRLENEEKMAIYYKLGISQHCFPDYIQQRRAELANELFSSSNHPKKKTCLSFFCGQRTHNFHSHN